MRHGMKQKKEKGPLPPPAPSVHGNVGTAREPYSLKGFPKKWYSKCWSWGSEGYPEEMKNANISLASTEVVTKQRELSFCLFLSSLANSGC